MVFGLVMMAAVLGDGVHDCIYPDANIGLIVSAAMPDEALEAELSRVRDTPANRRALYDFMNANEAVWGWSKEMWYSKYNDIGWLLRTSREKYLEVQDCPRLAERWLFGDAQGQRNRQIGVGISFSVEFQTYLQTRKRWEPDRADIYDVVLAESKELYSIHCDVYAVTDPAASQHLVRMSLRSLKGKLTKDQYEKGELPPCVPIWRFREGRR